MMQWIKNIICSICILSALLHVLPDSAYRKYVNFYIGLLIILMVLKPVASVFSLDETFEKTVQIQELKRELSELNIAWDGLDDLGTQKIEKAWKEEMEEQMEKTAKTCGFRVEEMEIDLEENRDGGIDTVSIRMEVSILYPSESNAEKRKAELSDTITEIYGIEKSKIRITVRE